MGAVNDVIALHDMGEKETHRLETVSFGVTTTGTEKVLTPEGLKLVSELVVGEVIMTVNAYEPVTLSEATGNTEHVYELQCTGDNLFYANGIMAEGINEDELKAIADAAEEAPAEEKPAKKTTKKSSKKDEPVEEATEEATTEDNKKVEE